MNVLFVTDQNPITALGGIERVVCRLAGEFASRLGYRCYLLYMTGEDDVVDSHLFVRGMKYTDKSGLEQFLIENDINVVLNNTAARKSMKVIFPVLSELSNRLKFKNYFEFHNLPGFEVTRIDIGFVWKRIIKGVSVFDNMKMLVSQMVLRVVPSCVMSKYLQHKYMLSVKNADRIVTLSESFINQYIEVSGDEREGAEQYYVAISNPMSWKSVEVDFEKKKKRVLVVTRLEEKQKRVSMMLDVWKEIEKDGRCDEWDLVVVGEGDDKPIYMDMSEGLKRCKFVGRQEPEGYYSESSIFMMTSSMEGFGVTLIEAQQNGVVPIVFDSFSAVRDIIENGESGMIVENDDIAAYVEVLKGLMLDRDRREEIARNAVRSVEKFSMDRTVEKWRVLLERN